MFLFNETCILYASNLYISTVYGTHYNTLYNTIKQNLKGV